MSMTICPTCYGTREVNAHCPDEAENRSRGVLCAVAHYRPCPRCATRVEEWIDDGDLSTPLGYSHLVPASTSRVEDKVEEFPLLWTTCCEQAAFDYDGLLWCPHHHDKRGLKCLRPVRGEKVYRCTYEAALFDADDEGIAAWCERMRPNQDHAGCGVRWLLNLEEER